MNRAVRLLKDSLLPLAVFAAVFGLHYLWLGLFPEQDPAQARWVTLPPERAAAWQPRYLEGKSYWLGYSYALSFAFASVAIRRFLRDRSCGAGRFAAAGLTFTGLLAVAGCYLIGCCGSPMLVVWMTVFGAKFLPAAKPFVAAITTGSIAGAWVWMARSTSRPIRLTTVPLEAKR